MKAIFLLIQLFLLAAGYGVFFNQWIKPSVFPYFNLLALGFPIIFVLNLGMLILWWVFRWKLGLLFTILSAVFIIPINKTFNLYGSAETTSSNLKMMTYNVQYFYHHADDIVQLIREEKPDVLFFQEMGSNGKEYINIPYGEGEMFFEDFKSLGIASKYPILEAQRFKMDNLPATFCYADIQLPSDTLRFINFYLESLHIDQGEIKSAEMDAQLEQTSKNLVKKVTTAAKIHEKQIQTIREYIKNSPHPVVVAGDMNAVPGSYEYNTMKIGLKDCFLNGGKGIASTFPGFGYPLRLDYIFVSPQIKTKSYEVLRKKYSDHYPVVAELLVP